MATETKEPEYEAGSKFAAGWIPRVIIGERTSRPLPACPQPTKRYCLKWAAPNLESAGTWEVASYVDKDTRYQSLTVDWMRRKPAKPDVYGYFKAAPTGEDAGANEVADDEGDTKIVYDEKTMLGPKHGLVPAHIVGEKLAPIDKTHGAPWKQYKLQFQIPDKKGHRLVHEWSDAKYMDDDPYYQPLVQGWIGRKPASPNVSGHYEADAPAIVYEDDSKVLERDGDGNVIYPKDSRMSSVLPNGKPNPQVYVPKWIIGERTTEATRTEPIAYKMYELQWDFPYERSTPVWNKAKYIDLDPRYQSLAVEWLSRRPAQPDKNGRYKADAPEKYTSASYNRFEQEERKKKMIAMGLK